nr:PREDICTED: uncharacterized protein LOC103282781 [Anolis carolinensis]|eukprot:XP_008123744.2 PREDICTED: uncharacterized protein LOC103282781 [Anolis carolinensis]
MEFIKNQRKMTKAELILWIYLVLFTYPTFKRLQKGEGREGRVKSTWYYAKSWALALSFFQSHPEPLRDKDLPAVWKPLSCGGGRRKGKPGIMISSGVLEEHLTPPGLKPLWKRLGQWGGMSQGRSGGQEEEEAALSRRNPGPLAHSLEGQPQHPLPAPHKNLSQEEGRGPLLLPRVMDPQPIGDVDLGKGDEGGQDKGRKAEGCQEDKGFRCEALRVERDQKEEQLQWDEGGNLDTGDDDDLDAGDDGSDSDGDDSHEGDGNNSGNSGGEDPDGDEDQDKSEGEDSDEEIDKNTICDVLLKEMEKLEQEIDAVHDPSQEKVDDLRKEVEHSRTEYCYRRDKMETALNKKVMGLWSALWLNSSQAVTALQETLSQFSAVEVASLKAESDSLQGFLQAAQGLDTLQKLTDFYCSVDALRDLPLLKVGPTCDDPLKEVDVIKVEMDCWCSALLRVLLKEGQEKTTALQEKVDAVQGISPEQAGELKVKMSALQKQMGLLWEVPLKEMMALLAMAYKLYCKLCSGPTKEENIIWKKACDHVVSLKVHLKDVLLWRKATALHAMLHDIPVEKLVVLEEKVRACIRKVDVLQNKIWKPLEEELKFLKEKLRSLKDSSQKGKLQKELKELKGDLEELTVFETYPLKGTVNALQKKMNALQKKINVPQNAGAPLEEGDEVMQVDKTGFSEMLNAQDEDGSSLSLHTAFYLRIGWQPVNSRRELNHS